MAVSQCSFLSTILIRWEIQIPPAPLTEERRKLDNIWLSFFVMGRDPVEHTLNGCVNTI